MIMHRIRSLLAVLLAATAAACTLPPASAPAPETGPVYGPELQATGEGNLFAALARTRVDWLFMGGDTTSAEGLAQVLVYVDGRYAGTLGELRTIPVAGIESVRMHGEQYVRSHDRRHPRHPFVAGIYVSRAQLAARDLPHHPFSVSVSGSFEMLESSRLVHGALVEDRFGDPQRRGGPWFDDPGARRSAGVGAALHYATRAGWGVELAAMQALDDTWAEGFDSIQNQAVSAELRATEVSVMATYSRLPLRVGIGPVYRTMQLNWASGFCACRDEQTVSTSAFGVAAGAALTAPAYSRFFVEVNARMRYYPSHDVGPYEGFFTEMDAGGMVLSGGVGLGFRL